MTKIHQRDKKSTLDTMLDTKLESQFNLATILKRHFLYSIVAWSEVPIITVVETLTHSIENVSFPTITICPQSFNSDRWGSTMKILDNFQRHCSMKGYVTLR